MNKLAGNSAPSEFDSTDTDRDCLQNQLNRMESDIDSLQDVLNTLAGRLTPVLIGNETKAGQSMASAVSTEWSPMRTHIDSLRTRIQSLRDEATYLVDNIDL